MKSITREEALELWLTTLEQHPERQTTDVLAKVGETEKDYKFCCLGQLCHLLYEEDEIVRDDQNCNYGKDKTTYILPQEIVDFMGFNGQVGEIAEKEESLADMNDNGVTWPEIAKFIRENPEKVFVS